jgi:sigma-54 specific flagellar transcriptional regulator A
MPAQPTPGAIRILKHYQWPGNVRELANLIERLSVLRPGGRVDIADLPTQFTDKVPLRITDKEDVATLRISGPQPQDFELPDGSIPLKRYIENIEIALIRRALRETNGVTAHAARHLQLRRTTLAEKMKRYGIRSDDDPSMP